MNIYLELTQAFNAGRLRTIISSGQAVVLHRLAIMSKDGDWVLREDDEAIDHVLRVLESYGAHYRFGAPLDVRWLCNGWSSHFEFRAGDLRVRTDFVSRPPRLSRTQLATLWERNVGVVTPVVDPASLVLLKQTNREKDYAVIGELARQLASPRDQLLYSRSAQDLLALAAQHPQLTAELQLQRPLLAEISRGREHVEIALDAERRAQIHANERRLATYQEAASRWAARWPQLEQAVVGLPLREAHQQIRAAAEKLLPFQLPLAKLS